MNRTPIEGVNADGSQRFNYELTAEEAEAGMTAMITGPIAGTISMADGTAYDVTEWAVPVHQDHVDELHQSIHKAHHAAGRFLDVPVPGTDSPGDAAVTS